MENQTSSSSAPFEYPESGYVFSISMNDGDSLAIATDAQGNLVYYGSREQASALSDQYSAEKKYDEAVAASQEALYIAEIAFVASMSESTVTHSGAELMDWYEIAL